MRRKLLVFAAGLFLMVWATPALAEVTDVDTEAGYRVDGLDWNIAGNSDGSNPNILSELTWKNLEMFQVRGKVKTDLDGNYLRGYFSYGWITDGENQDSDYDGDDRTGEFSRSNNNSDSGAAWDASAGVGFDHDYNTGSALKFYPVLGYSYHRQNLRITDGYQTVATSGRTPVLGPFNGLKSTYEARWYGPWAGMDFSYKRQDLSLGAGMEFHLVRYYADANWNLRSDFAHPKSFEHEATGAGFVFDLGAEYAITKNWGIEGSFDVKRFKTGEGTDRTFFSNGTTAETKLNEVNWKSYAMMMGLRYRF